MMRRLARIVAPLAVACGLAVAGVVPAAADRGVVTQHGVTHDFSCIDDYAPAVYCFGFHYVLNVVENGRVKVLSRHGFTEWSYDDVYADASSSERVKSVTVFSADGSAIKQTILRYEYEFDASYGSCDQSTFYHYTERNYQFGRLEFDCFSD